MYYSVSNLRKHFWSGLEAAIANGTSAEAIAGQDMPDPLLVLELVAGRITFPAPDDAAALNSSPEWARPIVQAAVEHQAEMARPP